MEIFHISSAIAAFGYAVAAAVSKYALAKGAGVLRLAFVANCLFVPTFAVPLIGNTNTIDWSLIVFPILTGVLFFLGQLFTFAAIRYGDVSLQTPIMGAKAVFVVFIAVLFGTETITLPLAFAAFASMFAVACLGFSGGGAHRVGLTISLALLSALFFAGSDVMMGHYGRAFGAAHFMFIAMLVNAALSFCLLPFFKSPLRVIPKVAWPWLLLASLLMAGQALLLNYTLVRYQSVAEVNVIYSMRGLWAVLIGVLFVKHLQQVGEPINLKIIGLRFAGALLMCMALVILFYPYQ